MKHVPDTFVEELRRRVDIVDVVSEYVQLRRSGRSLVGLCPFHNERTPSFSVSPDRQLYYCFGCGAGGTVFRFLMDIEGISFPEAVERLAERVGLALPSSVVSTDTQRQSHVQRLRDAVALAAKLYNHILMNTAAGVQALAYLEDRGLSRQTVAAFQLGYAPEQGDLLLRFLGRRGFDASLLVEAGLAVAVGHQVVDRFRGRVMIPICDAQGRVVAFGGRTLQKDAQPKYLNSPETPLFRKSALLFNWHRARRDIRKSGEAILLEGYMDVITAWQAGVTTAVASLGTSFTEEQAQLLRRAADRLVVAYDGDQAGLSAARRALDIAEGSGLEVRVVQFPEGMDPDDYARRHGADAFRTYLRTGQRTSVQFIIASLRDTADLQSTAGRTQFVRQVLEVLAVRASPIEQERELRMLSQEFHVSMDALKEELRLIAQHHKRHSPRRVRNDARPTPSNPAMPGHARAGRRLLQAMLTDDRAYRYMLDRGVVELADAEQTALLALIYGFRAAHPDRDPAALLDELDDPGLIHLASSLLLEDVPVYDESVLDDYLRTIELHRLEERYQEAVRASLQAQTTGDTAQAERWRREMQELAARIAELKTPPSQHGTG